MASEAQLAGPAAAPLPRDPHPGWRRGLLHGLYDLAWIGALGLSAPWWIVRSLRSQEFRATAAGRATLGLRPVSGARPRVLVHGVSVGEVLGARPLVAALERAHPGLEVVLSTTTSTGAAVARRLFPALRVVRFPLDHSLAVRRFLARTRPSLIVLIELEVWPGFLRGANRAGIPVAVVNGRITQRSFARYARLRRLSPDFERISLVCAQDEAYARRFEALCGEPARVRITGNIKADALAVGRREPRPELRRLLGGAPGQALLVAGSTHEPEERLLAQAWQRSCPGARLVLVPRHPPRVEGVLAALAELGCPGQRLTRLRAGETPDPSRPAVVDTVGELEGVYALADLVFVGGSLIPHGGQNMLEPAAQGRAVLYGPHVANFAQEAALLESAGAARRLADGAELAPALGALLADADARERMAQAGMRVAREQQGATQRTLAALEDACPGVFAAAAEQRSSRLSVAVAGEGVYPPPSDAGG